MCVRAHVCDSRFDLAARGLRAPGEIINEMGKEPEREREGEKGDGRMGGRAACAGARAHVKVTRLYFIFQKNQEREIKMIFFSLSVVLSRRQAAESSRDSLASAACKRHSERSARGQCRTSVEHNSTSMKASFEGKKKKEKKCGGGEKKRPVMKH